MRIGKDARRAARSVGTLPRETMQGRMRAPMRTFIATASILLCATLAAQTPPPPPIFIPYALDSGLVASQPGVDSLHVGDVSYVGTNSLQLWFSPPQLAPGSRVRLVSMRDGAAQWFDLHSFADYQNVSAFFNGETVRVELWPAPGSTQNRIRVHKIRIEPVYVPSELVCQATDIRVPSTDPRVGRIDGCCTTFLLDERTLSTAGHCIGATAGQIIQFNVPPSDAAGNPVYPPPIDQYALRAGSLTSVANGVGLDYAVMSTVRNSVSGLYAGESQGWLHAVLVPAGTAPQTWTVIGFGTSGVNLTWNLAQKSASGPRATTSNSTLQFRITVTGCNSGSPVIGTNNIDAHGVVTHAGCTATGGFNYGTGFGTTAYMQALQGVQATYVAGTLGTFGVGCGSASGTPQLSLSGPPDLGATVNATVTQTDPAQNLFGLLMVGVSDTTWNGSPLPIDLGLVGIPGCWLCVAADLQFSLSTNFGSATLPLSIPNQAAFLGASFYLQHFALDPTATNGAQVVTTNGARMRIGN